MYKVSWLWVFSSRQAVFLHEAEGILQVKSSFPLLPQKAGCFGAKRISRMIPVKLMLTCLRHAWFR